MNRLTRSRFLRVVPSNATAWKIPARAVHGPGDRFMQPGPMPLGDAAQRHEMERLIRAQATAAAQNPDERHPDAPAAAPAAFPGGTNPRSGERDGPRGPEPTRYGDWERNGRVYDF